jgi:hypothetical protein
MKEDGNRLIFAKPLWTNYAIQVNLRGIRENIVDKWEYLKYNKLCRSRGRLAF